MQLKVFLHLSPNFIDNLTAEVVDAIHHMIGEEGRQFDQLPFLIFKMVSQ